MILGLEIDLIGQNELIGKAVTNVYVCLWAVNTVIKNSINSQLSKQMMDISWLHTLWILHFTSPEALVQTHPITDRHVPAKNNGITAEKSLYCLWIVNIMSNFTGVFVLYCVWLTQPSPAMFGHCCNTSNTSETARIPASAYCNPHTAPHWKTSPHTLRWGVSLT